MDQPILIRTHLQDGEADIKALIHHDMETGLRKDAAGKVIPAHFINLVSATLNGTPVMQAQWGIGVSKNPFFEFKVKGAKSGDQLVISAVDNLGMSYSGQTTLN